MDIFVSSFLYKEQASPSTEHLSLSVTLYKQKDKRKGSDDSGL